MSRKRGVRARKLVIALALGVASAHAQPPGSAAGQAGASEEAKLEQANRAFRAGYAAMQAGRVDEARVDFARVVRLAPQLAEGHMALGAILVELGKPGAAIPELKEALKLKPGDPAVEENLARAHEAEAQRLAATDLEAAIAEMREAVAAGEPTQAAQADQASMAFMEDELGSLLARAKEWPEAEAAFRVALAGSGPDAASAGILMHLGVALGEEGRLAEAESELRLAAERAPGNAQVEYQLGILLAREGHDDEAVGHLEAAVGAEGAGQPVPVGGDLALAMSYQRLGRQAEAIPYFQKAVTADPRDASALNNLGLALTETGKAKAAVPYFERALAGNPRDPVFHEDLGVAYIQMSDFGSAIAQFEEARALDGANPQLHYDLGLAYKLKDRMEEAIGELKEAARLDPTLPDPPYTLGILLMQLGRLDEAAKSLRVALALRPNNGDGWAILGSVLKQLNEPEEAIPALRRAMELLPAQPGPRITLAAVLAEQGKRDEAAALRKEAADLSRVAVNRQRASFSMNAGNQLLLRGQIGDAVGRFEEAIAADPSLAEAHRQLAVAYDREGRAGDASAERAKADALEVAGSPESPQ